MEKTQEIYPAIPEVLIRLEQKLNARKGCFSFSTTMENALYSRFVTRVNGQPYYVSLVGEILVENFPLLKRAVDVFADCFEYFQWSVDGQDCFFDYIWMQEYSIDSLTDTLCAQLYSSAFEFYGGALGLDFYAMSVIGSMEYEKDPPKGIIALYTGSLSQEQLADWCSMQMLPQVPVKLCKKEARYIRKLLAGLSGRKQYEEEEEKYDGLLFTRATEKQSYVCRGYIKKDKWPNLYTTIRILKKGTWSLQLGGKEVFCVQENRVFLPRDPLEQAKRQLVEYLGEDHAELQSILNALYKQRHGTSVVFADLSKEDSFVSQWMKNLSMNNRALPIVPISLRSNESGKLSRELQKFLQGLSSVDGALIVDYPSRELRYTNAIVDGKAMVSGRSDAGARHNALRGFVANLAKGDEKEPHPLAVACIFSEDGDVSVEATCNYWQ